MHYFHLANGNGILLLKFFFFSFSFFSFSPSFLSYLRIITLGRVKQVKKTVQDYCNRGQDYCGRKEIALNSTETKGGQVVKCWSETERGWSV